MSTPLPLHDLSSLFDDFATDGARLDAFLAHVAEACVLWFAASGVSLFLRDGDSEAYVLAAQAGRESHLPAGTTLTVGQGIAGQAIAQRMPLLVQDPRNRRPVGSAMVVPLSTAQTGVIGVLNVARARGGARFGEGDLQTADNLARYVALAVHNARLFARLNNARAQTDALNAKLDAIIANLGVGILVVTEHEEVTGWNAEAKALFGEGGLELRHFLRGSPESLRIAVDHAFHEALTGTKSQRRAFDPDQDRAWSVVASPLPDGGVTLAIQEVSDHERAQRELARINRLAEIGQMTAAVAHEIRNPLTGIRSAAQMVQLTDEAAEFGRIIEEEALKLNGLCDQFLEFARPMQVNPREFQAAEVIEQVADLHRSEFSQAGVELRVEVEPTLLWGDPLRFEQVLRNLLKNALQACGPGDQVLLSLMGGRLCVRDSGKGITHEEQARLFTPFFTTKSYGTGLGLSTVRKIADAHHWRLRVDSAPGQGATFEVDLVSEEAA